MRRKIIRENKGRMEPGQDLVVAGAAGMAGAWAIAQDRRRELEEYFSPSYIEDICKSRMDSGIYNKIYEKNKEQPDRNLEQWEEYGATECEPAGEGGILTALWNLSGAYGVGIRFTLRQIPVKQSTIEICEYYDLNPYRLFSQGCYLLAAEHGDRLADRLKKEGICAAVIGQVIPGNKMEIIMEEGTACLDRPKEDEIRKVIPQYFENLHMQEKERDYI